MSAKTEFAMMTSRSIMMLWTHPSSRAFVALVSAKQGMAICLFLNVIIIDLTCRAKLEALHMLSNKDLYVLQIRHRAIIRLQ